MSESTPKPQVPLEWLYETLNKRVSQGIKLSELFLCVPYSEEAEFEFELTSPFKPNGAFSGNSLQNDYPELYKKIGHSRKESTIRVFFVHPLRLSKNLILWNRKFPYPRVNKVKPSSSLILTN